jgi:hypothetical protein
VEFEGTVDDGNANYAVGEFVSGMLTIDTDLAGELKEDPLEYGQYYGAYQWPACTCSEDFVTGFMDGPGQAYDTIHFFPDLENYLGDPIDYSIVPPGGVNIVNMRSRDTANEQYLSLFIRAPDLLNGYGLEQSFEIHRTPDTARFGMSAFITDTMHGVAEVLLSRFSMTPTPGKFTCGR